LGREWIGRVEDIDQMQWDDEEDNLNGMYLLDLTPAPK
jgi:hypothetical protein